MKQRFFVLPALLILSLFFCAPSVLAEGWCGDGILSEADEECDDGNNAEGDGCDPRCILEDVDPPTVASVSIPDGTTGIDTRTRTLTIVFSEPINSASVIPRLIRLEYAANPLQYDLTLQDDQKTVLLTVQQDLFSEASHAIRIESIADLAGNIMQDEFISVFYTAKALDLTPPNVVVSPPGGTFHFSQEVSMTPYIDDYTGSDEFIDTTAVIYYTLNDVNLNENSPVYSDPFTIREGTTLRYFAVDETGNKTPVYTERYSFQCPEFAHAKKTSDQYPRCEILECDYGYRLANNVCILRVAGEEDPDDYKALAVTAPRLPSDTPVTITTKPAIYITREHKGVIPRPVIFKDIKRGTRIEFEKNTKITYEDGRPFAGYIKHPENLYMKDFPIEFGYSFRSIFEFKAADGHDLQFDPPYRITFPYLDSFNPDEEVRILTFNPAAQQYSEYNRGLYESDLDAQEVTVTAYKTGDFFIAQTGKSFNRAVFNDVLTHWAKNYIEALYRKGIVKGRDKGIYAPNENLTRAEFVKITLKSIEADIEDPDDIDDAPFQDVPLYSWYAPYVKKAKDLGLITGYDDGSFRPDQFINRAEAVKMLFSAFNFDLSHRPLEASIASKKNFLDLRNSEWYFPYADFAIQHGIMEGMPSEKHHTLRYFGPGQPITRAEMAKLAIKTMELAEELNEQQ